MFLETIAAYTLIDLILGSLSGSRSLLTEVQLKLRKMTKRFFAKKWTFIKLNKRMLFVPRLERFLSAQGPLTKRVMMEHE